MILRITEKYHAYGESIVEKHYVLDMKNQSSYAINKLFHFIKSANTSYDMLWSSSVGNGTNGLFTASRYSFEFFDSYKETKDQYKHYHFKQGENILITNTKNIYNDGSEMINPIISSIKMEEVQHCMVNKKINKILDNFEYLLETGVVVNC